MGILKLDEKYLLKQIRQNRLTESVERFSLWINNEIYSLSNYSKFGVAFLSPKYDWKIGNEYEIVLKIYDKVFYRGTLKISHITPTEEKYMIGGKLDKYLSIKKVEAFLDSRSLVDSLGQKLSFREELDKDFVEVVDKFSFCLQQLKKEIKEVEKKISGFDYEMIDSYVTSFSDELGLIFQNYFSEFHLSLNRIEKSGKAHAKSFYLKYAQDLLTPYFYESEFGKRAVDKPLGYAGDYEMMNQIYRRKIHSDDLFSQVIHKCMIETKTCNSVRYRRELLNNYFLKKFSTQADDLRTLSVASGPAQELQDFIKESSEIIKPCATFDLLDLDKTSLVYAQSKLNEISIDLGKDINLNFINANVIHMAFKKIERIPSNTYDFIYSAGLYDYLDNNVSKVLTDYLYDILKPGGTLLIGNFSNLNTEKVFTDLVLDWFLIHKSHEDLKKIIPQECSEFKIFEDPNEIISYVEIKK